MRKIFLNRSGKMRSIWWVPVFFILLALFLFPIIIVAEKQSVPVPVFIQALLILLVTVICQFLRNEEVTEIAGKINFTLLNQFQKGIIAGAILMIVPALLLTISGMVNWKLNSFSFSTVVYGISASFIIAFTEEFLFRGFIFKRLIESIGVWPAQIIISGLFLLTHLNNPGMAESVKWVASLNIFLASMLFGLTYIRTKSLAFPIGLHFMANWTQGTLLGFGVSGNHEESLMKPEFLQAPDLFTGGMFGLEASLLGLATLIIMIVLFYIYLPDQN